ncbi:MAG: peroxidase [Hyphomicrobiaceae bacterium]|jgi:peroxidase
MHADRPIRSRVPRVGSNPLQPMGRPGIRAVRTRRAVAISDGNPHQSFPISLPLAITAMLLWALVAPALAQTGAGDGGRPPAPDNGSDWRSIDGSDNNQSDSSIGSAGTTLRRLAPADYADGVSELAGQDRASARAVSNLVCAQEEDRSNPVGASDFVWQWGQFVDHDIDLTQGADPAEAADITVPLGDFWFDPFETGDITISLSRSAWDPTTGGGPDNPREQINQITAWIDGSNVYGSDETRAAALRTNDGTGRLRTSDGNLLPFNEDGLSNAGGTSASLFLAGDIRANEQVGLLAMHTLFVREHNRLARRFGRRNRNASGDQIYEMARQLVGAEIQAITYKEFLPALLGPGAIGSWRGYDENIDASIRNEFSTASYRFGHSLLSPTLLRLDRRGNEIEEGHLSLSDAFFSPQLITDEGGIEPLLRGLAAQLCQTVDPYVVDDVRNFLFGVPGAGGFDLAALNIQRGRDHGLPSYNDLRAAYGLPRIQSFTEITSDETTRMALFAAYGDVDSIDAWVGGLAEDAVPQSMVGPTIEAVLVNQFRVLRDGDRFWYQGTLSRRDLRYVERMTLAKIIRKNTNIRGRQVQRNVFRVSAP